MFTLNITAIDQLGHRVYSVPSMKHIIKGELNSTDEDEVFGQHYFVMPPNDTKPVVSLQIPTLSIYRSIAGVSANEYLRLSDTESSFLVEQDLAVATQKCHPGFSYDGTTCVCDTHLAGIERFVTDHFSSFSPANSHHFTFVRLCFNMPATFCQ